MPLFSPAFRWGLIEAGGLPPIALGPAARFPRHFAGASLKREPAFSKSEAVAGFSPAFRWGLIEASITL